MNSLIAVSALRRGAGHEQTRSTTSMDRTAGAPPSRCARPAPQLGGFRRVGRRAARLLQRWRPDDLAIRRVFPEKPSGHALPMLDHGLQRAPPPLAPFAA